MQDRRVGQVPFELEGQAPAQVLVLKPAAEFLDDPKTVFR